MEKFYVCFWNPILDDTFIYAYTVIERVVMTTVYKNQMNIYSNIHIHTQKYTSINIWLHPYTYICPDRYAGVHVNIECVYACMIRNVFHLYPRSILSLITTCFIIFCFFVFVFGFVFVVVSLYFLCNKWMFMRQF